MVTEYPSELVEKAKFELHVFERVSRDTGMELLAEVEAWRARFPEYAYDTGAGAIAQKARATPDTTKPEN